MKLVALPVLLMLFGLDSTLLAQDAKLDTLLSITRDIQKDVKSQVESPLGEREYGVEINPFYLLAFDSETVILRGGFSWFGLRQSTELAFPWHYLSSDNYSEFFVDMHFREFFSGTKKGFYYEAIARIAHYKGTETRYEYDYTTNIGREVRLPEESGLRFGVGFGIGYRIFAKNGLYWGTSLAFGRFLTPEAKFMGYDTWLPTQTGKFFSYAELIKLGYSF